MSDPPSNADFHKRDSAVFVTTHWTTILAAGQKGSPEAEEAWEKLCRAYWAPVHGFVAREFRRWGRQDADADDLTQSFFAELIRRNPLARVKHDGRTFRSFLLRLVQRHLIDEHRQARADKRGGGHVPASFEEVEVPTAADPAMERHFDRNWAETLLAQALERVAREEAAAGKEAQFRQLRPYLVSSEQAPAYKELAASLGLSESALKMAVSRLRQRFGEAVREEVRQTVSTPAEIDTEIRYLMEVVSA